MEDGVSGVLQKRLHGGSCEFTKTGRELQARSDVKVTKRHLEAEMKYLEGVLAVIDRQGSVADHAMHERWKEVGEFKKYLWERGREMDLAELAENRRSVNLEMRQVKTKHRLLAKLSKARKSPFFGRLDFEDELGDGAKLYIGLMQIEEENQFYVYDWRAPISSLYYDYALGAASYEAPVGRIHGTITRRRQFKIVDGVMTRCFDADLSVVDDYLQEVLSHSSSEKMKHIVTTIQHEQNTIIRNIEDKFLIVQGVAGSGKTSVALHRVAYLLYKDKKLHASNVIVFSPNKVFTEYISDVLPDLGEENTLQTTFSDFAHTHLAECGEVESFPAFIERVHTASASDPARNAVTQWKLSDEFKVLVDRFAANTIEQAQFTSGLNANGRRYDAALLTEKFRSAAGATLTDKAERLADIISDEAAIEYEKARDQINRELFDKLCLRYTLKALYGEFLSWAAPSAPPGLTHSACVYQPSCGVPYEDSIAMVYLKFSLFGFPRDTKVLHVEMDEVQDYTLLQIEIIARIFEKAAFTVLGDVNQTINPFYRYATLKQLSEAFRGRSGFVELTKAYRSTEEIVRFANRILGIENVSAIRHRQRAPVVEKTATEAEFVAEVAEDLRTLTEAGLKSIAIITKTAAQATTLFKALRPQIPELSHLGTRSEMFSKKLVILPSYLSKGLEFDGVISYSERGTPYAESEKHLYYVVCTRAQHRLVVYNPPAWGGQEGAPVR
jgi:DNA helicase-2/ATP-dependent DNA helicase PcrA